MKFLSAKKLILIGFIVVLLIAIPLAIYLVQQQQTTQSEAQQATTLSFEPESTTTSPIAAQLDQPVSLDIIVDPGVDQNLVSFVRLDIQYDPAVLAPVEQTDTLTPFDVNDSALSLLEGPVFSEGNILATLSVGVDPTKVIQTRTTIATVTFIPIAESATPTEVTFSTTSQVLSTGPSDEGSENILVGTEPAFIQVGEGTGQPTDETATPSATITINPTATPSASTQTASPSATPVPTVSGGTGQSANQNPICESLSSTQDTTGTAPFNVNLNVLGSDANGTITQATFSFGDGQVQNVTTGGGLSTSSVNLNVSHTYTTSGNYQATAVLTDNNGGVSTGSCSIDIVVLQADGQLNPTSTPIPNAQLMDTGPGDLLVGAGIIVSIFTIVGAALFFML